MTTPFTISSLVTVSLSELSTFTFSAVVFDLVTSSSSFAIVLFDDVSLETEPVLVIKLELDSECASPLFSVGGLDDDGTFTQRLQRFSMIPRYSTKYTRTTQISIVKASRKRFFKG